MTYRKKPVEVEAFKIGSDDIPEWFSKELQAGNVSYNEAFYIKTLEGVMKADNGDYIIKQYFNGFVDRGLLYFLFFYNATFGDYFYAYRRLKTSRAVF